MAKRKGSREAEKANANRWRCMVTGCNPILEQDTAEEHNSTTGHKVAKWPVRSKAGHEAAKVRNQSGYYIKYNNGDKTLQARVNGGHMDGKPSEVVEMDSDDADFADMLAQQTTIIPATAGTKGYGEK